MSERFVSGGRELDALLQSLPVKVERNILRAALRAGAAPIREKARENLAANGSVETGLVAKGLRITTRAKGGVVTSSLKAGGPHGYIAPWVEWGTAVHRIRAKKAKALAINGNLVYGVVHTGARAKPFMRPALDAASGEAVAAVAAKVRERLTAEGLNTPAPEVS